MRARLAPFACFALVTAFPLFFALACGGAEPPAKTGGDDKPTGDDTTDTSATGEPKSTSKATETSTASAAADDGPSAGDYASMPVVTCGKTKCAQGQICATVACRPGEKCPDVKVCATPLNYKP
jgi:hypothetical protein